MRVRKERINFSQPFFDKRKIGDSKQTFYSHIVPEEVLSYRKLVPSRVQSPVRQDNKENLPKNIFTGFKKVNRQIKSKFDCNDLNTLLVSKAYKKMDKAQPK